MSYGAIDTAHGSVNYGTVLFLPFSLLQVFLGVCNPLYIPKMRCIVGLGSVRYSDRSIFRQVDIPTGRYSDRSLFGQVYIPTGRYSDRSLFRQVYRPILTGHIPTGLYSSRSIFRQVYIPTGRYSNDTSLFRHFLDVNCIGN